MANRRDFLKHMIGLSTVPFIVSGLQSCNPGSDRITGSIVGANHNTGHLLRDSSKLPPPSSVIDTEILIIGGGISALAAKHRIEKSGKQKLMMVEMDDHLGGNSVSGKNNISAYPWGAHYLPLPDKNNTELIDFLRSIGTITGFDAAGLPVYNEYHLCHDPEERLYINGHWQEGIVPEFGISNKDREQIKAFFALMEQLKHKKGNDGRYFFSIPIYTCSADTEYRSLDKISFSDYLHSKGFTSPYLLWYIEYCCKDDYGSNLKDTSAWAGIHYFAARRGEAANASSSAILTWPEGNGFLVNGLRRQCDSSNIQTGMLAYAVDIKDGAVEAFCYNTATGSSICIRAEKVLLCTPQYINKRLLSGIKQDRSGIYNKVEYAPWVVANISLEKFPAGKGEPLCWDNVIYGRESVGYVYANHQDLKPSKQGVITYYLPLTDADPSTARRRVHEKNYDFWKQHIINELEFAHPGITAGILNIDVWVWGHGMIRPGLDYIWNPHREMAMKPIDNKIFFAHSDLSGISIFEEAFYQGLRAANEILARDEHSA